MIKVFNGKWRGLGVNENGFGMILDFKFREILKDFKGARLAVFMAIALHSDMDGISYPSYDLLEKETGYSRATIAEALDDLCALEIDNQRVLMRFRVKDEKGQFTGSNHYLTFPTADELKGLENQSLVFPTVEKPKGGKSKLKDKPLIKDKPINDDEELKPRPNIFTLYEREIGIITPMISDQLIEAEKEYPLEWFEDAFKQAARNNKRSWAYAETILKRYKIEGFQSDNRPKNGNGKPSSKPAPSGKSLSERVKEAEEKGELDAINQLFRR